MSSWLQLVLQLVPVILALTPLAKIAPSVISGIMEAEQMPGATGAQKLAHVQTIAVDAAQAVNLGVGRVVLDPVAVQDASATAISTAVAVVNLVHGAHRADPGSVTTAPQA